MAIGLEAQQVQGLQNRRFEGFAFREQQVTELTFGGQLGSSDLSSYSLLSALCSVMTYPT